MIIKNFNLAFILWDMHVLVNLKRDLPTRISFDIFNYFLYNGTKPAPFRLQEKQASLSNKTSVFFCPFKVIPGLNNYF